jgi:hypothetical protein
MTDRTGPTHRRFQDSQHGAASIRGTSSAQKFCLHAGSPGFRRGPTVLPRFVGRSVAGPGPSRDGFCGRRPVAVYGARMSAELGRPRPALIWDAGGCCAQRVLGRAFWDSVASVAPHAEPSFGRDRPPRVRPNRRRPARPTGDTTRRRHHPTRKSSSPSCCYRDEHRRCRGASRAALPRTARHSETPNICSVLLGGA